jgi:rare lipoprotein A
MFRFLTFISLFVLGFSPVGEKNISEFQTTTHSDSVSLKNNYQKFDTLIFTKIGETHSATWYNMHGHKTASGEIFHKDSLTAAYNFSKLGSYLRVTNVSSGLRVIVKVSDRMGNRSKNHIDLSKCAFDSIANPKCGRIKVIVEELR